MTREELCALLQLPPETPPADLIQARARRLAEIDEALHQSGLPKPVRLKFRQEWGTLEPVHALIAELEIVSHIEGYAAEIETEFAKPNAVRGVIRLCLGKLKPLVPEVKDEATRFRFEKLTVEFEERLTLLPEVAESAPVPDALKQRIEAYFGEIAVELAKSEPGRGIVRLCLGKLKPLVEGIKNEAARYEYEKRIVQVEDRMGLRTSVEPFRPAGEPPPAGPREGRPGAARETRPKPATAAAAPARGTLLELTPARRETTAGRPGLPMRFVARPRFFLGRRRAAVDFATLFLPENDENRRKNETISRINTTFFVKDGQIWVQDGELQSDGSAKPSTNGTVIDGRPVVAARAVSLTKGARLRVGQHNYELLVLQLPAAAPEGPLLAATGGSFATRPTQVVAAGRLAGCVRFLPTGGGMAVAAVWIFTDAAVGSDPQSAVRLDQNGLPPVAARFHHWRDGFWIEVPAVASDAPVLDGRRLAPGEVQPLQAAHTLRLGPLAYEIRVS